MVEIESISSPHKLDPISFVLIARIDLDHVAAHAKAAALEIDVVAFVLQFDQPLQQGIARDAHPGFEKNQHAVIRIRIAETVNARDARDHDYIASFKQRARRRHAQAIDVFVDDRVLFDVSVRRRNVGFGLVIVVVRNEILDGVFRKERPEFLIKLGRQSLVVRNDKRRAVASLQ